MYPPVDPVLLQIGPLTLRWYGLLIVAGILVAAWIAARYVARKGQNPDDLWDLLLWVIIPGLIGARLYYVFVQSPRGDQGIGYYLANPWAILQIWTGGIHIYGAFILGGLSLILYMRWKKLPALIFLDGLAVGMPLGQALGRWANFINQELYGPPTTLAWGLRIDPEHRIVPYNNLEIFPESVRFHPLFLYESLWNLVGFLLLFWISRRFEDKLHNGDLFLMYLIWYPLGRFMIEFIRTDSWFFPGTPFNPVHLLSAIAVLAGVILLVVRHRRAPQVA